MKTLVQTAMFAFITGRSNFKEKERHVCTDFTLLRIDQFA